MMSELPMNSLPDSASSARKDLPCDERRVVTNFAGDAAGQQACLDLQHSPIGDTVSKKRVSHQRIHALFVGSIKRFATVGSEGDGLAGADEVAGRNHACVDGRQDGGVSNQWAKRFHQIEGQRRAAITWLMIEAEVRIEADRVADDRQVF